MMNYLIKIAITVLCVATSVECTSSRERSLDPQTVALLTAVDTDASEDAILGMWHRRVPGGKGARNYDFEDMVKTTTSLLFKRSPANVRAPFQMYIRFPGGIRDQSVVQAPFEQLGCYFEGNGNWEAIRRNLSTFRIQISGGKLLVTLWNDGKQHPAVLVYERT